MRLSRTLSAYIGKQFFFSLIAFTAGLVSIITIFDTLELFRRVSAREQELAVQAVISMALLKLPTMIEKAIPFSALLGAMFAFWRLNRHHEFVVARSAGVSIWQFLAPPITIAILVGLFKIAVFNPFSSAMLLKYEILEAKYIRGKSSLASLANQGLWFRQSTGDGHYILHARNISPRHMRLDNVIVFLMEDNDKFVGRIDSANALLERGFWRLDDATITQPNRPPVKHDLRRLPTDLTPNNINDSFAPPETISFWALPSFIKVLEATGFSGVRHLLHWHSHLALPLMLASVVILAATFSLRPVRRGGAAVILALGIGTGFLLYFLSDVIYALGVSSKIPVVMSAWSPALITSFLAIAVLLHLEDG
jgi:lipopolysaccharide export system permease protein|tara:strand:- start:781 stop:1878 length:1098 start_codon:yes stop_codon:yes gene_type:complete